MTLYVGIDVAKNKHDLAILRERGEIITRHFQFANSYQGFNALKEHLEQFNQPTQDIRIELEDTGHYSDNLVTFFQKLGYPVFTYNPLLIKEFVRSLSLRKSKTDKKDALAIARKLSTDDKVEKFLVEPKMKELKELTRYQKRLIHERAKTKTLYVRVLDMIFPFFVLDELIIAHKNIDYTEVVNSQHFSFKCCRFTTFKFW